MIPEKSATCVWWWSGFCAGHTDDDAGGGLELGGFVSVRLACLTSDLLLRSEI